MMSHTLLLQLVKSLGHSAGRVHYKSDKKYLKKMARPVETGEGIGPNLWGAIDGSKALKGIYHCLKNP